MSSQAQGGSLPPEQQTSSSPVNTNPYVAGPGRPQPPKPPTATIPATTTTPTTPTLAPTSPSQPLPVTYPPQYVSRPESVQPTQTEPPVILPQGSTLVDVKPTGQGYDISYVAPPPLSSYPAVYTKPISVQIQQQPNLVTLPVSPQTFKANFLPYPDLQGQATAQFILSTPLSQYPPVYTKPTSIPQSMLSQPFIPFKSAGGRDFETDVGYAASTVFGLGGAKVLGLFNPEEGAKYETAVRQLMANPAKMKEIGSLEILGATAVGSVFVGPELLPTLITPKGVLTATLLNVGISEGFSAVTKGKVGNLTDIANEATMGMAFYDVGAGVIKGLSMVAQSSVPSVARVGTFLAGTKPGRIATFTGVGAGIGYVTTGTPQGAAEGALLGFGFSALNEFIGQPLLGKIQQLRGVELMKPGPEVVAFEDQPPVKSYVSSPIEEYGGKSLQIVASTSAETIGTEGVTLESMKENLSGKVIETGHATLGVKGFNLEEGGETLLRGFPSEASGSRSELELLHFYGAPSTEEYVRVYGAYMGIGEGESEAPPQIKTGKPTLLTTTETTVSPELMKQPTESVDEFLARFSRASGQTGLGPETQIGRSVEYQVETPAAYTRLGEKLPGSIYVSSGKIGTYQIQQLPEGDIFGKPLADIPILRTMLSQFTTFDVYGGQFKAVSAEPIGPTDILEAPTSPTRIISPSISNIASPSMFISTMRSVTPSPSKSVSLPKNAFEPSITKSITPSYPDVSIPKFFDLPRPSPRKAPSPTIEPYPSPYPLFSNRPTTPSYPSLSVPTFFDLPRPSPRKAPSPTIEPYPSPYPSLVTPPSRPSIYPYPIPQPSPLALPSPSKSKISSSNPFLPTSGDFKWQGPGTDLKDFKIFGLESRKKIYPILSGKEVLKI